MKYVHVVTGCPKKNQHKHNPPSFPFSFRWKKPVDRHCCASTGEAKIQQGLVYSAAKTLVAWWKDCVSIGGNAYRHFSSETYLPKLPPPKKKTKALNGDFPEAHSHFFKNPTMASLSIISFWNIITWLSQIPPISSLYQSWFLMQEVSKKIIEIRFL